MNEEIRRNLKIKFMDGTEQLFEYSLAKGREKHSLGALIKETLNAKNLVLELQDRVMIIPFQNIKSIEIAPGGEILPEYAVRNVKVIG